MTITNDGPSSVTGATVVDPLPAGVTFVSATGGATYDAGTNTVHYTTGTIPAGGTETFTITVAVGPDATGTIANTATVSPPVGSTDPAPATTTRRPTLTTSRLSPTSPSRSPTAARPTRPGTPVTYTVSVHNGGPSTVHSLVLIDTVPAGLLNPVFGTPSAGSYDAVTGVWSGLDLAAGQSVTITLSGTPDPAMTGNLVNTATVSPPAGTTDSDPCERHRDRHRQPESARRPRDHQDRRQVDVYAWQPGHLHHQRRQPRSLERHRRDDRRRHPRRTDRGHLDIDTTGDASVSAGATGSGNNLSATVNIAAGAGNSVVFTVTGTPKSSLTGNLSNTATVAPPPGTTDSNPNDNSATDTDTSSASADVADVKVASVDPVVAGTTLKYTITVTNAGPSDATNVVVTDALDPALLTPTYTVAINGGGPSAPAAGPVRSISARCRLATPSTLSSPAPSIPQLPQGRSSSTRRRSPARRLIRIPATTPTQSTPP